MSKKLLIVGGEGNGGVAASCVEDNRNRFHDYEWEVAGFVNDFETEVSGYPVIGKLSEIPRLVAETDYYFLWAIHLVARNVLTEKMFRQAAIPDERLATVIHHSTFVASSAVLEPGVFVMYNTYIGPNSHIGKCSLVMANCSIGHDTKMGPLCHCSVGSIMTGYSQLGLCADLAIGASTLAFVKVGDFAMVGANSLATKDVPDYEIHVGSPAKFLKRVSED